jgi:hypothetical protein
MPDNPCLKTRQLPLPRLLEILAQIPPSSPLFKHAAGLLDTCLVPGRAEAPRWRAHGPKSFLTIAMATYDDYDGVYFSVQSIRLHHPEITPETEILVLDNNPGGSCSAALKKLEGHVAGCRYLSCGSRRGNFVRDLLFREANSDFVLAMDSHVLFAPHSLARLVAFLKTQPDSVDLWQGPLLYDNQTSLSTHFAPEWSGGMYGVWRTDERGADPDAPPFEIPMQGVGVFACRKQAWPGYNPRLSGFGGEEGYLHEKIRRNGGKVLCLPFLRWMHRFDRPQGTRYPVSWRDRIRNYLIEYDELGLDPTPIVDHFEKHLAPGEAPPLVEAAQHEIAGPFHVFDAIYRTNAGGLDDPPHIRHFPAVATPFNPDIGRALAHRSILEEARRECLKNVLILDDDFDFGPEAIEKFDVGLGGLYGREWRVCRLPGGVAFAGEVFNRALAGIPAAPSAIALWLRESGGLDRYYAQAFADAPEEADAKLGL